MDQIPPKTSLTPFAMISSSTAEALWTRIFAFAASPSNPDSFSVSSLARNRAALCSVNFTRKSLTLVSKQFHVGLEFAIPDTFLPLVGLTFEAETFASISLYSTIAY